MFQYALIGFNIPSILLETSQNISAMNSTGTKKTASCVREICGAKHSSKSSKILELFINYHLNLQKKITIIPYFVWISFVETHGCYLTETSYKQSHLTVCMTLYMREMRSVYEQSNLTICMTLYIQQNIQLFI